MNNVSPSLTKSIRPKRPEQPIVEKVIADAESFLHSQLTSGIAADQRAFVYSGFLSAAVAALVAGAASLLQATEPDWQLIALALSEGFILLVALFLAILSARPVTFWYAGNEPSNWAEDVKNCRPYHECLMELAPILEERIVKNHVTLKKNSRLMHFALWIAFGGILLGLLLFFVILLQRLLAGAL